MTQRARFTRLVERQIEDDTAISEARQRIEKEGRLRRPFKKKASLKVSVLRPLLDERGSLLRGEGWRR